MSSGAGGWLPQSTVQPGVRQPLETYPCGDYRTWSVAVSKDLTGYSAEWRLGVPSDALLLGLLATRFQSPGVSVLKTTGVNMTLAPVSVDPPVWALFWATNYADTSGMSPGQYWHQAVVIDPLGNRTTVAEGPVTLTPSLKATDLQTPPS